MVPLPKYLRLIMPRHFRCFRLRAHRLAVETDCWRQSGEHQVCSCGTGAERQDEKHVLLACRFPRICTLMGSYSNLFGGITSLSPNAGTSYAEPSRAVLNYFVFHFMNQCNRVYPFISDIMAVNWSD